MKPTDRLYETAPHLSSFTAEVLACEPAGGNFRVILDRTAFFPEGGGQYADKGHLGGLPILDVQIHDDIIYHTLPDALPVGQETDGVLDWPLRFSRMQSHTGEHIVSGVVHRTFGYDNIGFHLGDDEVTCDYNGSFREEDLRTVERRANHAVFSNLPVICEYPSPETLADLSYRSKKEIDGPVRIVTIPGVDICACCAPHVEHTGEIGLIKITGAEKSHGGTRLHLHIGTRALADYREKQKNILRIMDLCSVPQGETAAGVERIYDQIADLQHELSQARVRQGELMLESLPPCKEGNLVVLLPDAETDALRALANGGKEHCTGAFVALTNQGDAFRYMITAQDLPLRSLAREYNDALNGRGGGKDNMIQGTFRASLEDIQSYFA